MMMSTVLTTPPATPTEPAPHGATNATRASAPSGSAFWGPVLVALALAIGLRVWNLESRALNFDEVHEVTHCEPNMAELIAAQDGMPPGYHLVLGPWIKWFGTDMAARWLSMLFGVGTVIVGALWGRAVGGDRVGWLTALLLAVSSMHVQHSQEARVYSMYCFLVTLVLYFGWKLLDEQSWKNWIVFALVSWLAFAAHYYAMLAIALVWLIVFCQSPRQIWPRGIVVSALWAVALVPLVYCMWVDSQFTEWDFAKADFKLEDWAYTYFALIGGYCFGPPIDELRDLPLKEGVARIAPYAIAVLVCGLPVVAAALWSPRSRANAWRMVALLVASVLLLGIATRLADTGYVYRYMLWLVAPMCVLFALGLDAIRAPQWRVAGLAGLLAISLLSVWRWQTDPNYAQDDFHGVAALVDEAGADQPVLSFPHYFAQATKYHLGKQRPVFAATSLPEMEQNWPFLLADLEQVASDKDFYWIVVQWMPHDDARMPVCNELLEMLEAEPVTKVSNLLVYRAQIPPLRQAVSRLNAASE